MKYLHRRSVRFVRWFGMALLGAVLVASPQAWGHHNQPTPDPPDYTNYNNADLLKDQDVYTFAPFNLELRPYVSAMPTGYNNIISMTTRLGDRRLYATTQQGRIYVIDQNPDGTGTPTLWFDAANTAAGGVTMTSGAGINQRGLQSIAFHPDFDNVGTPGYGKFYATMVRNHVSPATANFLGPSNLATNTPDGVLAEWNYDHNTGTFNGFRELFRVNMPVDDHPIKQARFNPYAKPGDEDYGLLYLTHGDSNSQHSPGDYPQYLDNALGKMIRIDPLDPDGAGSARYSIPTTNPFYNYSGTTPVGHPTVLGEVYAYGFRNPHNFSFNKDDDGDIHILVGNIGRANVEEVELALPGHNYGWPKREGPFVELQIPNSGPNPDAGYISGVDDLPLSEADIVDSYGRRNTYAISQHDHNAAISEISSGSSIASGFVIRNGSDPDLHDQLIFSNFSRHDSFAYHADFGEMLDAVIELDPNNSNRDEPDELTYALPQVMRLALDHDNNSNTLPQMYGDFNSMLNLERNDTRYGEGVFGEMYISTKQLGGRIYLVTNSLPLMGDYNKDHVVDAGDYVAWRNSLGDEGYHLPADGNGNGKVDLDDYMVWKDNYGETWPGSGSGSGGLSGLTAHASSTTPEPTAAVMLAIGLAISLCARRARATRSS